MRTTLGHIHLKISSTVAPPPKKRALANYRPTIRKRLDMQRPDKTPANLTDIANQDESTIPDKHPLLPEHGMRSTSDPHPLQHKGSNLTGAQSVGQEQTVSRAVIARRKRLVAIIFINSLVYSTVTGVRGSASLALFLAASSSTSSKAGSK